MLSLDLAVAIVAIAANLALACVVILKAPHKRSTTLFLGTIILIVLWTFSNYQVDAARSSTEALVWMRLLYFFALGYIYLFFLFADSFGEVRSVLLTAIKLPVHGLAVTAGITTVFTPLVFSSASVGIRGLSDLSFGPLYMIFNILFLLLVAWSIVGLVHKARTHSYSLRGQITFIILGWTVFLTLVISLGAILPFFIKEMVNASKITPLFSVLMVSATTYSIVRHGFLDIRLIVQRSLVYSIVLGCILSLYICVLVSLSYLFSTTLGNASIYAAAITTLIGIFGAPLVEKYFQRITERIFFKTTYEYSSAVEALSTILNTSIRFPRLVIRCLSELESIFKPEFALFIREKPSETYSPSGPINIEDYDPEQINHVNATRLPIYARTRLIGTLILGAKKSGEPYYAKDLALLRTFSSQSAVAFQKAELYERLKRHSQLLERRVKNRTQHLEAMRQAQRDFMDDISHALQTPLTVIKSTLEAMPSVAVSQQRYFRVLNRSIDDLSRLIRNLLELARIDALPQSDNSSTFDLSSLTTEIAEYVRTVCEDSSISLEARIEPNVYVSGNHSQIEEAITNILSNAVRYTKDCPKRQVYISVSSNTIATLAIEDTGIGIAPEQLPHIFERFYRAQDEQGSGLGLAITKRIIERHNGHIHIESTLGTGTTVTIELPLATV